METITFSLDRDAEDDEAENEEYSVAKVRVVDKTGKVIEGARVDLQISTEGLLRLGKGLIRLSKSPDCLAHLHPSTLQDASWTLGVCLHPASAELLVLRHEFGAVGDAIPKFPPDSVAQNPSG